MSHHHLHYLNYKKITVIIKIKPLFWISRPGLTRKNSNSTQGLKLPYYFKPNDPFVVK
jgi:hypothetical protein